MADRHRAQRSCLAFLILVSLSGVASAKKDRGLSIADARGLPLGTTVTVQGTVTVPTNAFDPGFAIQEDKAGIYVLSSGDFARVLDDEVQVTGTLVESFGLLAIEPSSVVALGTGHRVSPRPRKTGDVAEATEGDLLKLKGTMVGDLVDDSPFGFLFNIDDGSGPIQVFLFPGTNISTQGLVAGAKLNVVCFSNQFETTFECDPRQAEDLEIKK